MLYFLFFFIDLRTYRLLVFGTKNKINMFSLEHLEKICMLLGCTPNDLLDWAPQKEDEAVAKHPLSALRREIKEVDLPVLLRELPLNKLGELQTMIEQLRKDK